METDSCGILFPRMQTNLIPFSPFSFLTDLAAAFTPSGSNHPITLP